MGFKAMKTRILSEDERGMIVGMRIVGMSRHCTVAELGMINPQCLLFRRIFKSVELYNH